MKLRAIIFCLILLVLSSVPLSSAYAAKVRARSGATVRRAAGVSYVTVRKSKPTHSLKLLFSNLGNVSKVSYTVQYTANGSPQGIVGSFAPTGQSTDTRDVYLGTCSSGVCTPHGNIKTIVVVIRVTLTSGATYTKVSRAAAF